MFEAIKAVSSKTKRDIEKEIAENTDLAGQISTEVSKTIKKIVIPMGLNKLQTAKELERQWDEEETLVNKSSSFENWHPEDVLNAITVSFEAYFGWVDAKTQRSFFGDTLPQFHNLIVDIVDGNPIKKEVFFGQVNISQWENATFNIQFNATLTVQVTCKKRFSKEVDDFFEYIRNTLKDKSIFKGKSVVVGQKSRSGMLNFTINENIVNDKIVLNEEEKLVINNFVIKDLESKGKRIYLFTGSYGNGKTETAMRVGKHHSDENKGTFFYIKESSEFENTLKLAVNYSPSLIFLEDIDEIGEGERDSRMNHLLNTLDGVETKGKDIKVIFTTNHEDRINVALRRPGRIDMIVRFMNPNEESRALIYKSHLGHLKGSENVDFAKMSKETPDAQGAVIAEIALRAKRLYEIDGEVSEEGILSSIYSMKYQIELMNKPVEKRSSAEEAMIQYGALLQNSMHEAEDRGLIE